MNKIKQLLIVATRIIKTRIHVKWLEIQIWWAKKQRNNGGYKAQKYQARLPEGVDPQDYEDPWY